MNGVHDMGGMQGFGPIRVEENEPVFHAPWEGRVLAIRRILGALGIIGPDALRAGIESIPPVEYLSNSYYENWCAAMVALLIEGGLVTREEVAAGHAANVSVHTAVTLKPDEAVALLFRNPSSTLKTGRPRRFQVGQRVRARNINPPGHTRLPRYVRGRLGVIEQERAVQPFPDTNAYGLGVNAQHVYSVRFAAHELWGGQASLKDAVYIDLWDDYLDAE